MFAFQIPRVPEFLIRRFPDQFEAKLSSGGLTAEAAAEIRRDVVDTGALTGGMNWYRAMMLGAPSDLKRRVSVPTTHVWSDADFALDRVGAELAADYVTADFRLEVFEGVSHWIPDQRPAELADVILARIASVSG
jgi:pimeloyl-ACP methyl ester carboxylesterase